MSYSTTATSSTYIDLATHSDLELFLYGGCNAVTWFAGAVQKSNWFSFVAVALRHTSGTPDFGQKGVTASVNRSGDYVLNVWFSVCIPRIGLRAKPNGKCGATVRWVNNLMHNLLEKTQLAFNELVVHEFSSNWLDVNYQFRLRGSKRIGYRNMIGDIHTLTTPAATGSALGGGRFSVPLPFFFAEDSGVALPISALIFNDVKIIYHFRRWQELVQIYPGENCDLNPQGNPGTEDYTIADVRVFNDDGVATEQEPKFIDPQTLAHYVVIHKDERKKMGKCPRDMLIHQVQEAQLSPFKDVSSRNSFDLRLSHAVHAVFWMAENISLYEAGKGQYGRELSNYTTLSNTRNLLNSLNPSAESGSDPIISSTLLYENTVRLAFDSAYYSLIVPYYFSKAIPDETGYHMYSYALHPWDPLNPSGSTNYSRLANVTVSHDMSQSASLAADVDAPQTEELSDITLGDRLDGESYVPVRYPQKFRHYFAARNWTVISIVRGTLTQVLL